MKNAWSVAAAVAILSGAAHAAPLSDQQLKEGRQTYVAKCAKCHELYRPNAYSQTSWRQWMLKMRDKSKLKPHEFDSVSKYTEMLQQVAPGKK